MEARRRSSVHRPARSARTGRWRSAVPAPGAATPSTSSPRSAPRRRPAPRPLGCEESVDVRRSPGTRRPGPTADPARPRPPPTPTDDRPAGRTPADRGSTSTPTTRPRPGARPPAPRSRVEQVAGWCTHPDTQVVINKVIDLTDHIHVDRYEPRADGDQAIERDVTCVFPFCTRPAASCDCDHVIPFGRGGPTCSCNTAPACRGRRRARPTTAGPASPSTPATTCGAAPTDSGSTADHPAPATSATSPPTEAPAPHPAAPGGVIGLPPRAVARVGTVRGCQGIKWMCSRRTTMTSRRSSLPAGRRWCGLDVYLRLLTGRGRGSRPDDPAALLPRLATRTTCEPDRRLRPPDPGQHADQVPPPAMAWRDPHVRTSRRPDTEDTTADSNARADL